MRKINNIINIIKAILNRKKFFYCELKFREFNIKIWDKPGQWLDKNSLEQIIEDVQAIANTQETLDYGILKNGEEDINDRLITIAYDKNSNSPIGFAAQIYLNVFNGAKCFEVLHLGLVFIAKSFRKKSLLGLLYVLPNVLLLLKRKFRPIWISNVSQVPCVIGVVAQHYKNVYPNPIKYSKQTNVHRLLFKAIMKNHRKVFGTGEDATIDLKKQIILNSYTGGSDNLKKSFNDCAKYRIKKVNEFCNNNLDYNRGDDFMQIGILSVRLFYKYFIQKFSNSMSHILTNVTH
ncbi:MAG: hypothetical protein ABIO44_08565 [Saprospiraceae bacterium]